MHTVEFHKPWSDYWDACQGGNAHYYNDHHNHDLDEDDEDDNYDDDYDVGNGCQGGDTGSGEDIDEDDILKMKKSMIMMMMAM